MNTSRRYEAAKKVVDTKQHDRNFEGAILDLTTAHALVNLYEALNPTNRAKFDTVPLHALVNLAFTGKAA